MNDTNNCSGLFPSELFSELPIEELPCNPEECGLGLTCFNETDPKKTYCGEHQIPHGNNYFIAVLRQNGYIVMDFKFLKIEKTENLFCLILNVVVLQFKHTRMHANTYECMQTHTFEKF